VKSKSGLYFILLPIAIHGSFADERSQQALQDLSYFYVNYDE